MYNKKLIYDVGLHNGDDTAGYLSKGYTVIAIEADPVQAEKAKERFRDYISKDLLKILNIGVASEEGEFNFYINEKQPEWNSFDLSIAAHGAYKLTDKLSLIDSPFKSDTIWSRRDILVNDWFIMSAK